MPRLLLLLLAMLTLACPARTNDDDGGADDAGDDDTGDDDDSTPPCDSVVVPLDITDQGELMDVLRVTNVMIEVGPVMLELMVGGGGADCPHWVGDDIMADDVGTATVTGDGCVSTEGYRYDGVAVLEWSAAGGDFIVSVTGTDFVLNWEGGSPGRGTTVFETMSLNGTMRLGEDTAGAGGSQFLQIDGAWNAQLDPGLPDAEMYPAHRVWPQGFVGTWDQEVTELTDTTVYRLQADLEVVCRSDLGQDWDLAFIDNVGCPGEPTTGLARVTADGHEVLLDPLDDWICDECLQYSVDGVAAPDPLCFPQTR